MTGRSVEPPVGRTASRRAGRAGSWRRRAPGRRLARRDTTHVAVPTRVSELVDAVVQAFRVTGFLDVEAMGGADEDAAFVMGGDTYCLRGVVKAKGAGKGVQMRHILQCNRWTDRRAGPDASTRTATAPQAVMRSDLADGLPQRCPRPAHDRAGCAPLPLKFAAAHCGRPCPAARSNPGRPASHA